VLQDEGLAGPREVRQHIGQVAELARPCQGLRGGGAGWTHKCHQR
jgi:hypothetical protein